MTEMLSNDNYKAGCLVVFSVSAWQGRKKVNNRQLADHWHGSNADLIRVNKDLVGREYIKKIKNIEGKARIYLRDLCFNFPVRGTAFAPYGKIDDINAKMTIFKAEFEAAVADFLGNYQAAIELARDNLGDLFDVKEYPHSARMPLRFSFEWKFLVLNVPENNGLISPEIYQAELNKFRADMTSWRRDTVYQLREKCAALVSGMTNMLVSGERVFGSNVEKLEKFFEDFKALDINGDTDLQGLVERMKGLVVGEGVNVDSLRSDAEFKARIGQEFQKIEEAVKSMLVDWPHRKLALDDDVTDGN